MVVNFGAWVSWGSLVGYLNHCQPRHWLNDYAIHYVSRYRLEQEANKLTRPSRWNHLRAIFFNSAAVVGFVLAFQVLQAIAILVT